MDKFLVTYKLNSGTERTFCAITVDGGTVSSIIRTIPDDCPFKIKVLKGNQATDELMYTEYFGNDYSSSSRYSKWRIDYPEAAYGNGAFVNERASDYGWFASEDDAISFGLTKSKSRVVIALKCA